jgi:CheY-like chemotaxis protein
VANTELLLEDIQGKRELAGLAELANEVLSSALRGADLTHRLLAVARRQPLSPSRIDLNEKLPAIVAMLQRTLGETIHVVASMGDGLWPVQIDPSQGEDALLNLAINARDAMPAGGTLMIETANVMLDEHYAAQHPGVVPGEYAVLSVTDTGVGMPPEIVERAIEPFFTTKGEGKGTGLGLAMVYGFVKQSNGHFYIYSQVGVGTTIKLYLPRADSEGAGTGQAEADQTAVASGHERLLVVDDNPALLKVATRQLSQLGYDIETAESGPAALELLKSGRRFSLLFTDLGLPDGMSGYDLAELAKQHQPWIKVLFTTGYARVERPQDDSRLATDPVLRKPYRGKELAAQVRALLDS